MSDTEQFWMQVRQALLMLVDAIERWKISIQPRTAELRKEQKQQPDRS